MKKLASKELMKKILTPASLKKAKISKTGVVVIGDIKQFITPEGDDFFKNDLRNETNRITVSPDYFDLAFVRKHSKGTFPIALDFGSGTGWTIEVFSPLVTNQVAVEISKTALDMYTKRPNAKETRPLLINNEGALPFKDNTFDFISFMRTYEHLPNAAFYLKEFHRVLKPGGIIYAVNDAWFYDVLAKLTFGTLCHNDSTHINMKTPNTMEQGMMAIGFTTVKKSYLPWARWNIDSTNPLLNIFSTKGVVLAKK